MIMNSTLLVDEDDLQLEKVIFKPDISGSICLSTEGNTVKDTEALYKDLSTLLEILLRHEYICKVREEEKDILVIEYSHDETREAWGCPSLVWVTPEEESVLECHRDNVYEAVTKQLGDKPDLFKID